MKQIAKFSFPGKSKTCPKDPQFNILTLDRLWDEILKVWNINNDSGVSEKRIKEDILNWVVSIDKIIEANGVYNIVMMETINNILDSNIPIVHNI